MKRNLGELLTASAAISLFLILASCSAHTTYSVVLDILSYIPDEERTQAWTALDATPDRAILLPYLEPVFEDISTVDAEIRRGIELTYPAPDSPEAGDLIVRFRVDADVFNDGGGEISSTEIHLYVADPDAENVFLTEYRALTVDTPSIASGETTNLYGDRTIGVGDPGFERIRTGNIRVGVEAVVTMDTGTTIRYTLNELRLSVHVRALSLL